MTDKIHNDPQTGLPEKDLDFGDGTFGDKVGAVLLPGENHAGEVGGNVGGPAAPVNFGAATAFAAGQVIGGVIELTNCARVANGSGLMTDARAVLKVANTAQIDVFVFSAQPAGTYTSGAAFTLDAADIAKLPKVYALTNWYSAGAGMSLGQSDAAARFFRCLDVAKPTSLFAICVARGTITLAAAADAQLTLSMGRN